MLINLVIGCELDPNSNHSECGLLVAALSEYRKNVQTNRYYHGAATDAILAQIDEVGQVVQNAMLKALECLEPLQIANTTNDSKTVYELRTAVKGGHVE